MFQIDQPGSQDVIDYALETLNYSAEQCVNSALEVDNDCTKALLIINGIYRITSEILNNINL